MLDYLKLPMESDRNNTWKFFLEPILGKRIPLFSAEERSHYIIRDRFGALSLVRCTSAAIPHSLDIHDRSVAFQGSSKQSPGGYTLIYYPDRSFDYDDLHEINGLIDPLEQFGIDFSGTKEPA